MPRERDVAARAGSRWWWRGLAVAAVVVLAGSVRLGLVWLFSDPQPDSREWLETLSWRAGVVGMFTGVLIGVAALLVSVLALRSQRRAVGPWAVPARTSGAPARTPAAGATEGPLHTSQPQPPSSAQRATATAADEPGGQAGGSHRSYGGDHVEFRGGTFHGPVVGKQVNPPEPKNPTAGTGGQQP
ncbi:hypothetical protein ACIBG7_27065 [Nonomuraea sp. NPDC050328]|uniref:hypothetical protein n=1 Tax=Nonomuraea sp. NPDC050328 TaxID=3364361 RepID=UPI0037AAAE56